MHKRHVTTNKPTRNNRTLLSATMSLSDILLFELFCRSSFDDPLCRTSFDPIKSSREVTEARWNCSITIAELFPSTVDKFLSVWSFVEALSSIEIRGSINFRRNFDWIGPGALRDLFSSRGVRFGFGGISWISDCSSKVTLCCCPF